MMEWFLLVGIVSAHADTTMCSHSIRSTLDNMLRTTNVITASSQPETDRIARSAVDAVLRDQVALMIDCPRSQRPPATWLALQDIMVAFAAVTTMVDDGDVERRIDTTFLARRPQRADAALGLARARIDAMTTEAFSKSTVAPDSRCEDAKPLHKLADEIKQAVQVCKTVMTDALRSRDSVHRQLEAETLRLLRAELARLEALASDTALLVVHVSDELRGPRDTRQLRSAGIRRVPREYWQGVRNRIQGTIASISRKDSDDVKAHFWVATPQRYFDALIADPRAASQQAVIGLAKSPPFLQKQTTSARTWDIDVGAEIPLFGWERGTGPDGYVAPTGAGAGAWFVFDFHMIEDLKDTSHPILNTDYRFSALFKGQWGVGRERWVAAKLQAGHESTHLGDEYSLAARRLYPAFMRVNVSYEWLDGAVSYETPSWKWRGGVVSTLPFADSYYDGDTLETGGAVITRSHNWFEPYVGIQRRSDPMAGEWGWYASADVRLKSQYDYAKLTASTAERRVPSVNVLVGVWPQQKTRTSLGVASPYLRAYYGVNPHGQFRNDPYFWLVGLGLRLDR